MKNTEYIKWQGKTQKWKAHGEKTARKLFNDGLVKGGYWAAGYSQAITDFILKFKDKI